jgi:NADP-dependent 3-hydroxy acid dehydrogenase YdfG
LRGWGARVVVGARRTDRLEALAREQLGNSVTHAETAAWLTEYRKHAIPADAIARAIAFAIAQPPDVDVNEIVVRPTSQP